MYVNIMGASGGKIPLIFAYLRLIIGEQLRYIEIIRIFPYYLENTKNNKKIIGIVTK